jgi:hypothetical protein
MKSTNFVAGVLRTLCLLVVFFFFFPSPAPISWIVFFVAGYFGGRKVASPTRGFFVGVITVLVFFVLGFFLIIIATGASPEFYLSYFPVFLLPALFCGAGGAVGAATKGMVGKYPKYVWTELGRGILTTTALLFAIFFVWIFVIFLLSSPRSTWDIFFPALYWASLISPLAGYFGGRKVSKLKGALIAAAAFTLWSGAMLIGTLAMTGGSLVVTRGGLPHYVGDIILVSWFFGTPLCTIGGHWGGTVEKPPMKKRPRPVKHEIVRPIPLAKIEKRVYTYIAKRGGIIDKRSCMAELGITEDQFRDVVRSLQESRKLRLKRGKL